MTDYNCSQIGVGFCSVMVTQITKSLILLHKVRTRQQIAKNFYGRIIAMIDSDNYSSSTAIILQGPTNPSHKNYYMEQEWVLILMNNLK